MHRMLLKNELKKEEFEISEIDLLDEEEIGADVLDESVETTAVKTHK